jgi:hypothetical protein
VFQVVAIALAVLGPGSDPKALTTTVRSATIGIIGAIGIIALSLIVELFDYLL